MAAKMLMNSCLKAQHTWIAYGRLSATIGYLAIKDVLITAHGLSSQPVMYL